VSGLWFAPRAAGVFTGRLFAGSAPYPLLFGRLVLWVIVIAVIWVVQILCLPALAIVKLVKR
jgi:hypothetical protein